MTATGGGDWREKWQEKTRGGYRIRWVSTMPEGFVVMRVDGTLYTTDEEGRAWNSDNSLIPLPPAPVAWSKESDVDPLIDRIRGKNHDEGWLGGIVTAKLNRGLVVLSVMVQDSGENPAPYCRLIPWCDMERHLYTRVGERVWRPTVCEGGK